MSRWLAHGGGGAAVKKLLMYTESRRAGRECRAVSPPIPGGLNGHDPRVKKRADNFCKKQKKNAEYRVLFYGSELCAAALSLHGA